MKSMSRKSVVLLCMLLAITVLSGCTAKPDTTDGSTAGTGYNAELPWDVPILSTVPPAATTTPETSLLTPGVMPSVSISPLESPTTGITGFVTPTPSVVTPVPSPAPTSTPAPTATPLVLRLGSTGNQVRAMQSRLRTLGYLQGPADGDFGKDTENALRAFQSRNKLTVDGLAGPSTLNRLNSNNAVRAAQTARPTATARRTATPRVNPDVYLQLGSSGAEVRRMQNRLIELGYLEGSATGQFGASTEAAVIAFQKRNVSYFDGIAGPLTLSKLYADNARRASTSTAVLGTSLQVGIKDSDAVRTMQRRLKDLRYYTGAIDGDFGPTTEVAVKAFQTNNGLRVDGKAGENTLNLLYSNRARSATYAGTQPPNAPRITPVPVATPVANYRLVTPHPDGDYITLELGHMGTLVSNLQQALKNQGYYAGVVDGKYGLGTVEAVRRFQAANGLSQDGKAGAATQRVLYEGNYPIGS